MPALTNVVWPRRCPRRLTPSRCRPPAEPALAQSPQPTDCRPLRQARRRPRSCRPLTMQAAAAVPRRRRCCSPARRRSMQGPACAPGFSHALEPSLVAPARTGRMPVCKSKSHRSVQVRAVVRPPARARSYQASLRGTDEGRVRVLKPQVDPVGHLVRRSLTSFFHHPRRLLVLLRVLRELPRDAQQRLLRALAVVRLRRPSAPDRPRRRRVVGGVVWAEPEGRLRPVRDGQLGVWADACLWGG